MARRTLRMRRRGRQRETASAAFSAGSSVSPEAPDSSPLSPTCGAPTVPLRSQQLVAIQALTRAIPAHALLLAGIPRAMATRWLPEECAALTGEWSAEDLSAAAVAQANWLGAQQGQDPRITKYAEPIAPDELKTAMRVMRSLFNWNTDPDISLAGAMYWAGLLLDLYAAAEARDEPSPLPLPHLWLSRGELETIERWDERAGAGSEGGEAEDTVDLDAEWVGRRALKAKEERGLTTPRPRTLAAMPQPAAHARDHPPSAMVQ